MLTLLLSYKVIAVLMAPRRLVTLETPQREEIVGRLRTEFQVTSLEKKFGINSNRDVKSKLGPLPSEKPTKSFFEYLRMAVLAVVMFFVA
jgi:hypothetical protein